MYIKLGKKIQEIIYPVLFIIVVLLFFWKFIFQGLLPIPSDTVAGLYHPYRDFYSEQYPNGIPYKNFLITDPVRQQYPWRELAIEQIKNGKIPSWNPYSFSGSPLLANLQSAILYPFNMLLLILPFEKGWSLLILLQPLLAGLFLYAFLRKMGIRKESSLLGALSWAFSGFFIAWLTWGTIIHVVVWLPLMLLSIDWIIKLYGSKKTNRFIFWTVILIFSLSSSFFAGHLQTFFYSAVVVLAYTVGRLTMLKARFKVKLLLWFFVILVIVAAITSVQWIPLFQFISLSSRAVDQLAWTKPGWFIPYQHLTQFFAPDFFGNPATLNYFGAWNYAELVGYVGVVGLLFAMITLFLRRDKKTLFFGSMFFISLIFAVPSFLAKLPYQLSIPLISTSQPTRLLSIVCLSLAILSALGLDYILRNKLKLKQLILPVGFIGTIYIILWIFALFGGRWLTGVGWAANLAVTKRNLILPTALYVASILLLTALVAFRRKKIIITVLVSLILLLATFDLLRFGRKFTPFTRKEYLYPKTETIAFLKSQPQPFRVMATDKRILPPNFSIIHNIQTVDGYDPLYLANYGEFASSWVRNEPDVSEFSFNRIITPQNFYSRFADMLNVSYILSLDELTSEKLEFVFEEGQTKVYKNKNAYPRAYLVESVMTAHDKQDAINLLFDESIDLSKTAVVYDSMGLENIPIEQNESAQIMRYEDSSITVDVAANYPRLLVLSDVYHPNWKVYVDEEETTLYEVNYAFRGVVVPEGRHMVIFNYSIL